jgi:hypothetical protein
MSHFSVFDPAWRNATALLCKIRYRFTRQAGPKLIFKKKQINKGYANSIDDDNNSATPNTIIFKHRNVVTYLIHFKIPNNSRDILNLSSAILVVCRNKNFLSLNQDGGLLISSNYNQKLTQFLFLEYGPITIMYGPGSQVSYCIETMLPILNVKSIRIRQNITDIKYSCF